MSHEKTGAVDAAGASRAHVEDVVSRLVGEMAPDAVGRAAPDQWLIADLGYYSLLMIELAFALEDLFGLDQVAADDPPPVGTVRDLQDYVVAKVAAGEAVVPDAADVDLFLRAR